MTRSHSGTRPTAAMLLYPGLTHLDLVGLHAVLASDMDGVPERSTAEAVERARSMVAEPDAEIVRRTAVLRDSRAAVRHA